MSASICAFLFALFSSSLYYLDMEFTVDKTKFKRIEKKISKLSYSHKISLVRSKKPNSKIIVNANILYGGLTVNVYRKKKLITTNEIKETRSYTVILTERGFYKFEIIYHGLSGHVEAYKER